MKQLIKSILYHCGFLGVYHRARNSQTLTVIMLHRVLPHNTEPSQYAMPEWTIDESSFDALLKFLNRHYNIINLETLRENKPLPARALLITFDDGWRDNFIYAFPLLKKYNTSATVFLATDYIGKQHGFWQETLYHYLKADQDGVLKIHKRFPQTQQYNNYEDLLSFLDEDKWDFLKQAVFNYCRENLKLERQMLNEDEIKEMLASGLIDFGGHGCSHSNFVTLNDYQVKGETEKSAEIIRSITNKKHVAMSFPHGGYNDHLLDQVKRYYFLIFTSDEGINKHQQIDKTPRLYKRIHISPNRIGYCKKQVIHLGHLSFFLFTQPSTI